LLDIAKKLEEAALRDSYFVERKLYPNVDFYSGIIMRAIGIPVEMFTVIFAIAGCRAGSRITRKSWKNRKAASTGAADLTGHTLNHYIPQDERKINFSSGKTQKLQSYLHKGMASA